ncbi:MAG: acyltransferase [Proteobacteria bacterium]|nr:acyltransferase [Pseudomonadota bacterium]
MPDSKRLYYVDWLRVLAMLALFLFHADRFFDFYGWHVKNDETNLISTVHVNFFVIWMMPLFFVLSGAAIYHSLQFRNAGEFISERCKRILVPLLILGYFVTSPPQSYLDRLTNGQFSGSFLEYIPHYFQGVDMFGGNFPWHAFHLWYLLYLFVFSICLLPLFTFDKNGKPGLLARFSNLFTNPWSLVLLIIPIVIINVLIDTNNLGFMRGTGGWDLFSYMFFLSYGYLVFSNPGTLKNIYRLTYPLLVIAVVTSLISLFIYSGVIPRIRDEVSWFNISLTIIRVISSLAWIGGFIGLCEKYLNFKNGWLGYANQAVMPFYILHQLFLLLIGYYVVQWEMPVLFKFIIIAVAAFIAIMLAYEYLVRRIGLLRILFGMKKPT